jgi:hypothetical protein
MVRRYVMFSALLALAVAICTNLPMVRAGDALPAAETGNERSSGIKFSHKTHVGDVGAECIACHPGAPASTLSADKLGSSHESCTTCHEEQVINDCAYCHTDPDNIVAGPVMDREIIFAHNQHVAMAGVECTTCHAGIENVDLGSSMPLPAMATCNTCHNDRKATNACESCHTDFVNLFPADHSESNFLRNHKDMTRLGALDASCQTCHTETFCQQCHQGAGLKGFTKRDLTTEPRGKTSTRDGKDQMVLQNAHELNYRFTHGFDAKSRQSDCASCHVQETFCVECHQAGGNITQLTFKPASHAVPGFTTLGPGSGGGLHADEARRDIETCMSCHNVEGADPTCMTCHTETGRVR